MARTAEKAESLAEESQSMADAMARVLRVADEQGTVEWSDVSGDITSGEWGRLIEQGILVDVDGEGFVVDDPEGVRDALGDDAPAEAGSTDGSSGSSGSSASSGTSTASSGSTDDEDEGWSRWDKLAAVATVALFLGYSQAPIRNGVGGVIDLALGPLADVMPFYIMILVLATFTGFSSTVLQGKLMNMEKMGEYQERMQEIQERRKEAKERGDDEALEEIQEEQMEAMGDQLGMFKEQFRPMVWIMLVNIPVFLWIYFMVQTPEMVAGTGPAMVLPLIGEIATWNQRIGPMWAWIVWYFVCSMSFTQIVRKALDVQTTPSTS
ncbi:DUF106 domain-containing protein [Halosimplex halophilum]|uniref:DUF106 domain-containing protein n=1 Tax=Halosimplex halophilum TaxID=2559572 RepID=UPI00107F4CC7|nr:DUF106 domain-containing protein [Halosimplex halophilum]